MSVPWIATTPVESPAGRWLDLGEVVPPSESMSRWWDGAALQDAELLGWWDGAALQPVDVLGWWDGAAIQPLEGV